MQGSGSENQSDKPGEGEKPRRTRNEMVADAFKNKRLPDDWVEEEPEHDEEADDQDGENEFEEAYEPYVPPEPDSHRVSATAFKAIGCLVGAFSLIGVAILAHLPSLALVALWLGVLGFAGGSLYLLNRLVGEHEREFTVLIPGILASAGAFVLLLVGLAGDANRGGFFAFTIAAAVASLGYAVWHNSKHFGWGNAIVVTLIEAVFTPIAIVLAVLWFFRHDVLRTAVPGGVSSGSSNRYNGDPMPEIGSVSQNHGTFFVFDERGDLIHQMNFDGALLGYTSKAFQVQSDRTVYTFDAHCRPLRQRIV